MVYYSPFNIATCIVQLTEQRDVVFLGGLLRFKHFGELVRVLCKTPNSLFSIHNTEINHT